MYDVIDLITGTLEEGPFDTHKEAAMWIERNGYSSDRYGVSGPAGDQGEQGSDGSDGWGFEERAEEIEEIENNLY